MRGSRNFCQSGSNFDNVFFLFFLFDEERKDPNTTISRPFGPPAKRHLNGISLAGRRWPNIECWIGSYVILR